ncbi:hypothetical protein DdX_14448 [Ditylenchus destructor]|uniref:Uncharacterized protein n=1 Tax=Ditylenchus destructor TaxID=166010 RepID=A0AAD4QVK5_9BILA|nr:hypothetical protein DdX_14448 [Ditylenchus destructor]
MAPFLNLALIAFVLKLVFLRPTQSTNSESNMVELIRLIAKIGNDTDFVEDRAIPVPGFPDWATWNVYCIWKGPTKAGCVSMSETKMLAKFDTSDSANLCTDRMKEIIDCIDDRCSDEIGAEYTQRLRQIKDVGCAHLETLKQMDHCKNSHLLELRQVCNTSIRANAEPNLGDLLAQTKQINGLCTKFDRAHDCVMPVLTDKCNHVMPAETYYSSKAWAFFNFFYGVFGNPGDIEAGKLRNCKKYNKKVLLEEDFTPTTTAKSTTTSTTNAAPETTTPTTTKTTESAPTTATSTTSTTTPTSVSTKTTSTMTTEPATAISTTTEITPTKSVTTTPKLTTKPTTSQKRTTQKPTTTSNLRTVATSARTSKPTNKSTLVNDLVKSSTHKQSNVVTKETVIARSVSTLAQSSTGKQRVVNKMAEKDVVTESTETTHTTKSASASPHGLDLFLVTFVVAICFG